MWIQKLRKSVLARWCVIMAVFGAFSSGCFFEDHDGHGRHHHHHRHYDHDWR